MLFTPWLARAHLIRPVSDLRIACCAHYGGRNVPAAARLPHRHCNTSLILRAIVYCRTSVLVWHSSLIRPSHLPFHTSALTPGASPTLRGLTRCSRQAPR